MPEILYSKFSKDRQKKFQIATMIVEESGEKSVIKKAMHKEGEAHVRKMVEYPRTAFGIICKFRCGNVSMQRGKWSGPFFICGGGKLRRKNPPPFRSK